MKVGDLVVWTASWLAGCVDRTEKRHPMPYQTKEGYSKQIGVILSTSKTPSCYKVTWSDGETIDVHRDYLEVL